MLQSAIEFFKNLPPKQCSHCGDTIKEQHDCYHNQCQECITKA